MLMVLVIIVAFSVVPSLLGSLIQTVYSRPRYSGRLRIPPGYRHVCICGIVSSAMLQRVLLEISLGEKDNLESSCLSPVLVVILCPVSPNTRIQQLLRSQVHSRHIKFLVGSSRVTSDLERVRLHEAMAVIVIGEEKTSSMRVEEDSIFLSAMSVAIHIDSKAGRLIRRPRLITMLTHTAKLKKVLHGAGIDVVLSLQEFKYNLLGASAALPGLMAIFMKLNRPSFQPQPHVDDLPNPDSGGVSSVYQIDISGCCEVDDIFGEMSWDRRYFYDVLELCGQIDFSSLALWLFRFSMGEVVLIGVIAAISGLGQHTRAVFLNPGANLLLSSCESLFIIAPSRSIAIYVLLQVCQLYLSGESHPIFFPGGNCVHYEEKENNHDDETIFYNVAYSGDNSEIKEERKNSGSESSKTNSSLPTVEEEVPLRIPSPRIKVSPPSSDETVEERPPEHDTISPVVPLSRSDEEVTQHQEVQKCRAGHQSKHRVTRSRRWLSESGDGTFQLLRKKPSRPWFITPASRSTPGTKLTRYPSTAVRLKKLCPFIRLEGTEGSGYSSSSSSQGPTYAQKLRSSDLSNHLVLVLSSSGQKDVISAHNLMMPVVYFLRSYRAYRIPDDVIILSERADELSSLSGDISLSHPGLLDGVSFYVGFPRNIDHLRLCSVNSARAVVILHHPTPSTLYVEGDDDPAMSAPSRLNADRHTIIVSLNLHFILEGRDRPTSDHSVPCSSRTFTLVEVRHESNTSYLRRSYSTILTPAWRGLETSLSPTLGHCREGESLPSAHAETFCNWNLVSAGSVLSQPVFESLLFQTVLNPDIVQLWETLLASHQSGSSESSSLRRDALREDLSKENVVCVDAHRRTSSGASIRSSHLSGGFSGTLSSKFMRRLKTNTERQLTAPAFPAHPSSDRKCIDRIRCPPRFVGKPYLRLFEAALLDMGCLPFAVCRWLGGSGMTVPSTSPIVDTSGAPDVSISSKTESQLLPYVHITPDAEFVLQSTDFVFIVRTSTDTSSV
mmetsp:Transcript_15309/g.23053  ORF Transcript_15309/g.23053 Transcript_15309/m.23053 type:complete len:1007 (+) Transcript_15309:408-3428(+)